MYQPSEIFPFKTYRKLSLLCWAVSADPCLGEALCQKIYLRGGGKASLERSKAGGTNLAQILLILDYSRIFSIIHIIIRMRIKSSGGGDNVCFNEKDTNTIFS